jgi:hypothetical protein
VINPAGGRVGGRVRFRAPVSWAGVPRWWAGPAAAAEFGNVLVEGGAADAEQPGDGRDAVLESGK